MKDAVALTTLDAPDRVSACPTTPLIQTLEVRGYNRKSKHPSLSMHPPDGNRYRCPWIEDSVTIHSDGNVSCGLDDPHSQRSFGNVKTEPLQKIFAGEEYHALREKLWAGHRCIECGLYQQVPADVPDELPPRAEMPQTMVVEPTVACNIRCPNDVCIPNNDSSIKTRDSAMLSLDAFRSVVDQLQYSLRYVYFFNYGEPFVHPQAGQMLTYLKRQSPQAHVVTSTNGIPLHKPDRAKEVVASGLDFIVFTIGGVRQASYERYHVRGQVAQALAGLTNVLAAKRELGLSTPFVNWRYLLFNWNDSDDEVREALEIAKKHGVNEFSLYLTHIPAGSGSYRFSPGSPNFSKYREYIASSLGYPRFVGEQDSCGFYPQEIVGNLGVTQWTGWQARLQARVKRGRLRVSFATVRPAARKSSTWVYVSLPWTHLKVPVGWWRWQTLDLPVPASHSAADAIDMDLLPCEPWFPAEEIGVPDLRCLGVLVKDDNKGDDASPTASTESPAASPLSRKEVARNWMKRLWKRMTFSDRPALSREEQARLSSFSFHAPRPLIDHNAGRLAAFDDSQE